MRKSILSFSACALLVACASPSDEATQAQRSPATSDDGSSADANAPAQPETDDGFDAGSDSDEQDASAAEPVVPGDVQVAITSDNAFSFGYGDEGGIYTFVPGVASGAGMIFDCPVGYGPQTFVVPGADAPEDAYLYIVAWADRDYTQGTLAQFKRDHGGTIYSGDEAWQVCATGKEYDPNSTPGPDQATVNEYLKACNAGAAGATFSKGWVDVSGAATSGAIGKLAQGEANDDASGEFPIVCQVDDAGVPGIDAAARWMWFDPADGRSAFTNNDGNRTHAFLIFRLPALILF
ncbi:MAG: hypothetical protein QM778_19350 [Myxococcales bacterium]